MSTRSPPSAAPPERTKALAFRGGFELGNALAAHGMDDAAELFDLATQPLKLFGADAVVLRLCRVRNYAERARDTRAFP